MAIDASKPQSPGWWLARLGYAILNERADEVRTDWRGHPEVVPGLDRLKAYAEGRAPLPQVPGVDPSEAMDWMNDARTNWCSLVIDSPVERLGVDGFRFGETSDADDEANRIWQENGMDAESEIVHYGALSQRRHFVLVEKDTSGRPRILQKSTRQVAVARDPHDHRKLAAGLYIFVDEWTGESRAKLWTPGEVHEFVSPVSELAFPLRAARLDSWDLWTLPSGRAIDSKNELGAVPLIPFVNRRNRRAGGFAEHEDSLSIQNRINSGLIQLMAAGRYGAFRQRFAAGLEVDEDPVTGERIAPFKLDIKTLWTTDNPEVNFGEFAATDLRPYVAAIGSAVQDLAAISKTPPHYLLGQVVNVSGDALKAAETGLASKVKSKKREFGESWEQVMRLAFQVLNDPRADVVNAETIWADSESRTVSELADAAVKKKAAGVPWRQRMEDMGYTPTQIDRMEVDRAQDSMMESPDPTQPPAALQPPPDPRAVIGRADVTQAA
ncbi:phage portal protein [Kitasatospora fiedleri]|uniref:phage portal protein n=1 Tax=Kitasatospora fiedleri TaxID=2991545 RepID=UPI00249C3774|nr:phage portal protein [Kitasatospora fiedleri]